MQNKKVIRISEQKAGTFTIIPNSILHNKNLKDFDKILLFSILSDSDTHFTFNQETYAKRFACGRKRISKSIDRLTLAGYVKHENKGFNNWQYVISEYGNLNADDIIKNELPSQPHLVDLSHENVPNEHMGDSVDFEKIGSQIDVIIETHFPNIPQDILVKYVENMIDCINNGKVKIDDFTDEKIIKSISKVYQVPSPTKISITECELIIKDKMTGGTQNQRNDTLKKVKQWFVDNDCVATDEEIRNQTFKTHHSNKTANRIIDQKYND